MLRYTNTQTGTKDRADQSGGKYRSYFRPIYLDTNALAFDQGSKIDDDDAAESIVELHNTFDDHYGLSLRSRPFLSYNDIEALLLAKRITKPLPPVDRVISISRTTTHPSCTKYEIISDKDDYWQDTYNALEESGAERVTEKFNNYLEMITRHGGSYHHVTIGSRKNWLGRVYLAFRRDQIASRDPEWILSLRTSPLTS